MMSFVADRKALGSLTGMKRPSLSTAVAAIMITASKLLGFR